MGVRVSEFWGLTMNELYAIEKAYKQMKKDEYRYHDELCYRMSCYFFEAENIALHNQVGGMFTKNLKRLEYRDKSITQELEERKKQRIAEENMTVEQKIEYTNRLFSTLSIMQHNFEKDHPKNENNPQGG
jgi:hypothetical protein